MHTAAPIFCPKETLAVSGYARAAKGFAYQNRRHCCYPAGRRSLHGAGLRRRLHGDGHLRAFTAQAQTRTGHEEEGDQGEGVLLYRHTRLRVLSEPVPQRLHAGVLQAGHSPHGTKGDLIVGLSSRGDGVVYAMCVSEVLDFRSYWDDPRFACKRPDKTSPDTSVRRGDNIYQPWGIEEFRQLPSSHSNADGSEDVSRKRIDLSGRHVLVADRFTYFGSERPLLPEALAFLRIARGHRCRYTDEQIAQVVAWFEDLTPGLHGKPALWGSNDSSWCDATPSRPVSEKTEACKSQETRLTSIKPSRC
jgi:hypothetical protein